MSDPFIGQIMPFGGNFPPKNWAFCDGSILSIASNSALFAILGNQYGGNGTTTFALPDLRGRVPIGQGNGPGLSNYAIGQVGGQESHTLNVNEIPAHSHTFAIAAANEASAPQTRPGGNILGPGAVYEPATAADTALGGVTAGPAGGNLPHENRQPYIALNYIIALYGIFPPRS